MTELNIFILEKVIHEIAPELLDIYNIREDESEEQQIKTGQLHENRILGIILNFYLSGKRKVTTRDVEVEYKKYYKEIARSTISTYLNMLKKEGTLFKERDGRLVYYIFKEDPPKNIEPFWFSRLFCIDPAYFHRAIYFASLYSIADVIVKKHMEKGNYKELLSSFKYLTGVIILYILKSRSSKCVTCQFGKREKFSELMDALCVAIKDRTDVLPSELTEILEHEFAEIPIFNGLSICDEKDEIEMIKNLLEYSNRFKKDMEFQTMVLTRRLNTRLLEKVNLEAEELKNVKEKAVN